MERARRMGLNVASSPKDLWEASEYFEGTQPREILEWVVDTYDDGELVLSAFFSGAEGMTLIDMTSKITEEVTILTIDTRFLFKETHEFCKEVMRHHRLPLDVRRPALTVEEQVERYGERKRICSPDLC